MPWDINFPTDTAELSAVATNDLIPIYDVSAPWDLKEAQAVNIAKTLIDDTSTTATERTWSVSKIISYILTKVLTWFTVAWSRTAITASDTILSAFGKAQKYFNDLSTLAFSWSVSDLTGTLGISQWWTGQTTNTAWFDALAPTTTQGDMIYHNGTDNIRLAKGTGGQILQMNAWATAPEWVTKSLSSITILSSDFVTSSTSLTDITGLSASLVSGKKYSVKYHIIYSLDSSPNQVTHSIKYNWTANYITWIWVNIMTLTASTIDTSWVLNANDDLFPTDNTASANTKYHATFDWFIDTTSASTIIWRIKTSWSNLTVHAGSYIEYNILN